MLQTGSGRGTSFAVSFPVAAQPVAEPSSRLSSGPPGEAEAISPALHERIVADNAFDLELFAFAKELLASRSC